MGSLFGIMSRSDIEVGGLLFISMLTSNYSLTFVNYPFMVLAKSAKILPVILIGWIRGIYKPERVQFVIAASISTGLILFNLKKADGLFDESLFGIGLVLTSLLFDGLVST